MVNQCYGLAEALPKSLKLSIEEKIICLRAPWKWGTPFLRLGSHYALSEESSRLDAPYPDIVISCGRQAIVPALHVKKASGGRTIVVHIQNPVIDPSHFDALVVPQHDNVVGSNVIQTLGAPHRITAAKLEAERLKFPEFQKKNLEEKLVGVLIGGACKAYPMDQISVQRLVDTLKEFIQKGHRLLISPSRRTPIFVIEMLKSQLLKENPEIVYLWDMQGENPYFSILANSDTLIVTCDSVCMITEACVTDKSVYLFPLKGGNRKFEAFHGALLKKERVKWLDGKESLQFEPVVSFNEMQPIVEALQKMEPTFQETNIYPS